MNEGEVYHNRIAMNVYCMFCGRHFWKYRQDRTNRRNRISTIRQSNAQVCSKKCAKKYRDLKLYGEKIRSKL